MRLLERRGELGTLSSMLDRALAGEGCVAQIEGPPGIGKTELVRATRSLARERGAEVLAARGGELERKFAFGVVRQLLEPAVLAADEQRHEELFSAGSPTPRAPGSSSREPISSLR